MDEILGLIIELIEVLVLCLRFFMFLGLKMVFELALLLEGLFTYSTVKLLNDFFVKVASLERFLLFAGILLGDLLSVLAQSFLLRESFLFLLTFLLGAFGLLHLPFNLYKLSVARVERLDVVY